jgi:hypothetical protein
VNPSWNLHPRFSQWLFFLSSYSTQFCFKRGSHGMCRYAMGKNTVNEKN